MNFNDKNTTVAFSGYRLEKIFPFGPDALLQERITNELVRVMKMLYVRGFRTFISGMATGFDLWAARAVVSLRESGECPELRLVAAVPCPDQASGFDPASLMLYREMLSKADERIEISPVKTYYCFLRRNDWMLDNASVLVCYYDGQRGGTDYTVKKARTRNLPIINLCERLRGNSE